VVVYATAMRSDLAGGVDVDVAVPGVRFVWCLVW
jgi:hypothetical protein